MPRKLAAMASGNSVADVIRLGSVNCCSIASGATLSTSTAAKKMAIVPA